MEGAEGEVDGAAVVALAYFGFHVRFAPFDAGGELSAPGRRWKEPLSHHPKRQRQNRPAGPGETARPLRAGGGPIPGSACYLYYM